MARIGELPGRIGHFIGDAAQKMGQGLKSTFGLEDSGLPKEEELYGINPRRAYWSAALADLANVAGGGQFQGKAQETAAAQRQWQEQLRQQKLLEEIRKQQLGISYLNAVKSKTPSIIEEAKFVHPNDPVAQREFIEKYRSKQGQQINIGGDMQTELMKGLFEMRPEVEAARTNLRRYQAMLDLIPNLGKTGPGAEAMTTFRGFLNQFGMEEYAGFIDRLAQIAGIDIFSGEQGARELFRALGNQDIVGQAKELYPVSNSDIQILKQMTATLYGSDPRVLEALIRENMTQAQGIIDEYNMYRSMLRMPEGTPGMPPVPEPGRMDLRGLDQNQQMRQEIDQLRKELRESGVL